ncbi:Mitotic spindle-associated MMXD complex subunit MIP18 [Perkinsus olseni]|uniref:Mitotic spindle-associated MMXD complex subunit MIP18 n=1 Tax=Perkinsus olseni TaxID=32597 RepID=A0A7J6L721_PEROL|nr:Mitotic spindle-associated MMXD complex subunit MIP18 [Perkinsus olseni]KAF4658123.1 Mitotic spindle-associated MMXD complex subunit MIP18 [Perkinsus olseni]
MTCPLSQVFVVTQDVLGHGATATVRRVIHKRTGEEFALKSLSKRDLTAWQEKNLLNEVEIFLSVDHPNICRLAYVFEAPTMVHLVMELCRGPDLHEMIYQRFNSGGYFSEPEVADIIAQVLYAINYLHTSNIVHRDIKPSHFMFTCGCPVITDPRHVYDCPDRRLKLFDFGLARRIGSSKSMGGGTLSYMAPECLEIEWESRKPLQRRVSVFGEDDLDDQQNSIDADQRGSGSTAISAKCDIWGVGVICHLLLTGKMPFESPNVGDVLREMRKIRRQRSTGKYLSGDRFNHLSEAAKSFLRGCLQVLPSERFSARQALDDQWLADMLHNEKRREGEENDGAAEVLPWDVLESMRRYAVANSLRKAALNMVASGLTSREVHDLEKTFVKIDVDHDGVIQFSELLRVIAPTDRKDMQSVFRMLGKSTGSGKGQIVDDEDDFEVEYSQFLAAAVHMRSEMFRDRMREIFGRFDIDGNGTISEDELKTILSHSPSTGDDLDAEVADLLAKFDKDGNGVIDYEEFLAAMDDDEGSRDKTWVWAQRHEIHSAPLLDKHSPYVGTFAHAPGVSPISRRSSSVGELSPRRKASSPSPTATVRPVRPFPKPASSLVTCCERGGCVVM